MIIKSNYRKSCFCSRIIFNSNSISSSVSSTIITSIVPILSRSFIYSIIITIHVVIIATTNCRNSKLSIRRRTSIIRFNSNHKIISRSSQNNVIFKHAKKSTGNYSSYYYFFYIYFHFAKITTSKLHLITLNIPQKALLTKNLKYNFTSPVINSANTQF